MQRLNIIAPGVLVHSKIGPGSVVEDGYIGLPQAQFGPFAKLNGGIERVRCSNIFKNPRFTLTNTK